MAIDNSFVKNGQVEFFRLPKSGARDPYFGLPRSTYYELEKAGKIRLARLRKRGYTRGTTLVPFEETRRFLHSLMPAPPEPCDGKLDNP
jgi:hypothetical protein